MNFDTNTYEIVIKALTDKITALESALDFTSSERDSLRIELDRYKSRHPVIVKTVPKFEDEDEYNEEIKANGKL
jgi:hypothetical protein